MARIRQIEAARILFQCQNSIAASCFCKEIVCKQTTNRPLENRRPNLKTQYNTLADNPVFINGHHVRNIWCKAEADILCKAQAHQAGIMERSGKIRAALCELVIDGIDTNIEEQLSIVSDERFTSGKYDLTFMGNR